jgi:eukaryotic-like serine/threonine-protein kinase
MNPRDIVATALRLDPNERAAYLITVCGDDQELLKATQTLLLAPPTGAAAAAAGESTISIDSASRECSSGITIGSYKLVRQLGEGGMGVVYHARQLYPIRRDVALKIIKPGMDSNR